MSENYIRLKEADLDTLRGNLGRQIYKWMDKFYGDENILSKILLTPEKNLKARSV